MSGSEFGLAVSVFLACAVEAVEALTIVLAVGYTRSWRSTFTGVGAASCATRGGRRVALGPALTSLPINALRVLVGGLLLIFGLQWLRKAILRGRRAEGPARRARDRTSTRATLRARQTGGRAAVLTDTRSRSPSRVCLLEGLEVVFIVLTFGANQHASGWPRAAAASAVLVVVARRAWRCTRRSPACPRTR